LSWLRRADRSISQRRVSQRRGGLPLIVDAQRQGGRLQAMHRDASGPAPADEVAEHVFDLGGPAGG
jgi:hypothetical protein